MALQNDLTTGSTRMHLIRFALPLVVSNLFQALYNAVDMFFVGRYTGTAGLSGVSVAGPIMNIMLMTIAGLSSGVMVAVARQSGKGDEEGVSGCANTAIGLYLLLSITVMCAGWILTPTMLRLVQTPAEAFPHAVIYLRTIFAGVIFMFGYNLICAFQRGFGDAKSSMYFVIVAAGINIILDFIFLKYFAWGAFGAAVATVVSQAASFLMGIVYFRQKRHIITFAPSKIRLERRYLKELFQTGLPTAGNQFLLSLSLSAVSGFANGYGLAASAAYGIGVKIDGFAQLPFDAVNQAVCAFSSQNIGAGKRERPIEGLKEGLKLSLLIASIVCTLVFLFAPQLTMIFNQDPEVVHYATIYLRIDCFSYLLFAVVHCLTGFIRGTGNAIVPLYNVIWAQYVVRLPVAFFFTRWLGFAGVAIAMISGPLWSNFSYGIYVAKGKWKKRAFAEK